MKLSSILALALACCATSCVISPRRSPGGGTGGTGGTGVGQLYVSGTNGVSHFGSALTGSGDVSPTTVLNNANLTFPQQLVVDPTSNQLIIANGGSGASVVIFRAASSRTGSVAPDAVLAGNLTTFTGPNAVAFDRARDLLYVADGSRVLVFTGESAMAGNLNVAPTRIITTAFAPGAIFLDQNADRLYAADTAGDGIAVFDTASTKQDPVSPNRTIAGPTTGLNQPDGLALDNSGRLAVSNSGASSITVYASAATLNGDAAPVLTIAGTATGLGAPAQLVFDNSTNNGDLYIADTLAGDVLIYTNTSSASGTVNAAPNRNLAGTNTGLAVSGPRGITLDPTR